MKYKVGDKVRVRKNLALGSHYGREKFVEKMKSFIGKAVTISKVCDASYMILEDGGYAWTDEMFEGLAEEDFDENNNGNTIRPRYYQSTMGDVFDIANAYQLDMPLGTAAKYILRAGKKDKAKEIEDLCKAIRCIERAIELREGRQ